jgi:hypothetical protein
MIGAMAERWARLVQCAGARTGRWTRIAAVAAAAGLTAEPAAAQPNAWERWEADSLEVAADAQPLHAVGETGIECDPPYLQVVRDSAELALLERFRGCQASAFPALGRELYVRAVLIGDCHASHEVQAFRSESRREYRVVLITRYGGCRAGRVRHRWIRLPALPEGWTVAFTRRTLDRDSRSSPQQSPD